MMECPKGSVFGHKVIVGETDYVPTAGSRLLVSLIPVSVYQQMPNGSNTLGPIVLDYRLIISPVLSDQIPSASSCAAKGSGQSNVGFLMYKYCKHCYICRNGHGSPETIEALVELGKDEILRKVEKELYSQAKLVTII